MAVKRIEIPADLGVVIENRSHGNATSPNLPVWERPAAPICSLDASGTLPQTPSDA